MCLGPRAETKTHIWRKRKGILNIRHKAKDTANTFLFRDSWPALLKETWLPIPGCSCIFRNSPEQRAEEMIPILGPMSWATSYPLTLHTLTYAHVHSSCSWPRAEYCLTNIEWWVDECFLSLTRDVAFLIFWAFLGRSLLSQFAWTIYISWHGRKLIKKFPLSFDETEKYTWVTQT